MAYSFNPLLHENHFLTPLKYYVSENIMENGAFALGANAPFSKIFSKVFKTLLKFFLIFFNIV